MNATLTMSDEQKEAIDYEFKRSELRWRSDMDSRVDKLVLFADEYRDFLRMLVSREAARAKLRETLIEKGIGAFIWVAVIGVVTLAWNGALGELKAMISMSKGGK